MELEKRMNKYDEEIGNFIQVYLVENRIKEPVIRRGYGKHKDLLKGLLEEFGLPFETRPNDFNEYEIPVEKKDGIYELVGAGRCDLLDDGRIGLSGKSADYNIKLNAEHIKEIAKYFPKTFVETEPWGEIINEF